MKETERIDRILNLIAVVWRRNPDMELGQLLYDFANLRGDIFNCRDDLIESTLIAYVNTIKREIK